MNTEHNCDFEDGSSILAATPDLGLSPNKMQDGVEHSDGEESSDQTELSDETSVPDGIAELSTSKLQIKEKTYSCNDCSYKSAIKHHIRCVHKDEDAKICTGCGKSFINENVLLEHMAKHNKDFFCEQCGTF